MPDIFDMIKDSRPTMEELFDCEHENTTYQPTEYHETDVGIGTIIDISVHESYTCDDCGKELDLPERYEE